MSNFHVNQDVVCIKSFRPVKEGSIYTIHATRKTECMCEEVVVHVGFFEGKPDRLGVDAVCAHCGGFDGVFDNIWWLKHSRFAPLQTKSEEEDMNEAIEEALSQPAFQ